MAGTLSLGTLSYRLYEQPTISMITPILGPSIGGTPVTVHGAGFAALAASDASVRSAYLRCAFGDVAPVPTVSISDSAVVCNASWGTVTVPDHVGVPFALALNALSYTPPASSVGAPRFYYYGTRPPELVAAHFAPDGGSLIVRFDVLPTDRGGKRNGLFACAELLEASTAEAMRGAAAAPAQCGWSDDSTLVVHLTALTNAAAGMAVRVRAGAVCSAVEDYFNAVRNVTFTGGACAGALALSVDPDHPCDRQDTAGREECGVPTAIIQRPSVIGACAGTSLYLDGSRSTGGGVKPLSFAWRALPQTCDNYWQVKSRLEAVGDVPAVELRPPEIDGGGSFAVVLTVTSYLGVTSAEYTTTVSRSALPLPSVTIEAPPLLYITPARPIQLEATARLAPCASNDSVVVTTPSNTTLLYEGRGIEYAWSHVSTALLAGSAASSTSAVPELALDPASRTTRVLAVATLGLMRGVRYTLRVTCCVSVGTGRDCSALAETSIALRDQPLQGEILDGDRTIGEGAGFILSACDIGDPDDRHAQCVRPYPNHLIFQCGILSHTWTCHNCPQPMVHTRRDRTGAPSPAPRARPRSLPRPQTRLLRPCHGSAVLRRPATGLTCRHSCSSRGCTPSPSASAGSARRSRSPPR